MIHYEELKTDPDYNGMLIARGKVIWLDEQQTKKLVPSFGFVYDTKFDESIINTLKGNLISALKKKGYVFFDTCVYRYTLQKNGKLKDVGINFRHIS